MKTQTAPPQMGQNIIVLMDEPLGFLDVLHTVVSCLPQIADKFFTLLCCCPTRYWEHGGADSPEVQRQIENVWKSEEEEINLVEHCLNQAKAVLHNAGVPDSHIFTKISTGADSLIAATVKQLRQGHYSGVIVSDYHNDIVNRLLRRGITDIFRQIPKVEVWVIDTDKYIKSAPI